MSLTKSQLKLMLKEKETKLFLAFGLYPLLLIIVRLFNTNFMQLSAPEGTLDFMTFFQAAVYVQYHTLLPSVALIYLVIVNIGDEVRNNRLYLYKDINRTRLLSAKQLSLVIIYIKYVAVTFISSLITYYFSLINEDYASGAFFPADLFTEDTLNTLAVFMMSLLIIWLSSYLSIKYNNGVTLTIVILFQLFSQIASRVNFTRYLLPPGIMGSYNESNGLEVLGIMLVIFLVWMLVLSYLSYKAYSQAEM